MESAIGHILKAASETMMLIDGSGKIVASNDHVKDLFGYEPAELLGQSVELLLPARLRELHEAHRVKYARHPVVRPMGIGREFLGLSKEGKEIPVEISLSPIELSKGAGTIVSMRDIAAARQRAELDRQQTQIIDQIHDAVVTTDLQAYVTRWNLGAQRIFGFTAEEAVGRHISFVYPEDQKRFLQQEIIAPLLERGEHQVTVEMCKKSGQRFHAHLAVALLRDEQGRAFAMIGCSKDITEQVEAERTLETRIRQQAVVAGLGQLALQGVDLPTLMDAAVSRVAETLTVEYTKILELLPERKVLILRSGVGWRKGLVGSAEVGIERDSQAGFTLLSSEPVIVRNLEGEHRFHGPRLLTDHGVVSGISVIIEGEGHPFGILGAHTSRARTFTGDDVNFVQAVANVLALAIDRGQAHEQLKTLARRMVDAMEGERRRISRELHDQIGQGLTAAKIGLLRLERKQPQLKSSVRQVVEVLDDTVEQVRHLSQNLRPASLDDLGLVSTLRWYLEKQGQLGGFSASFQAEPEDMTLPSELETNCYRIVQEAVTNVLRHAQASRVDVTLRRLGRALHLSISDDGQGFDVPDALENARGGASLGLLGMKERVRLHNGTIQISSAKGRGSRIEVELPTLDA